MSSIYRKGRDGYYYYQTYIFNPKSNKKDKKVFHALGTKDKTEAEAKQLVLDANYKKKSIKNLGYIKSAYSLITRPFFIFIYGMFAAMIITVLFPLEKKAKNNIISKNSKVDEINLKAEVLSKHRGDFIKSKSKSIELKSNFINKELVNDLSNDIKELRFDTLDYSIQRVERSSNAFEQCKIYVTVHKNTNTDLQKSLCDTLYKKYNSFSNILICLYSKDSIGTKLALGENSKVSISEKRNAWLAMFTFNKVEGHYFDNDPTKYLSVY